MKVRDVVAKLKAAGWIQVRQESSHMHFRHPNNPNVVTVSGHPGEDVQVGLLRSIERLSGVRLRRG